VNALLRGVVGEEATITEDGEWGEGLLNAFIGDLPISKLTMLGGMTEQDLAQLIEVANAG
jgi:hypothetical protein